MAETDHHDEHHHVMSHLRTYHCSGWSEEPTTIYLTSHNNPVEIVSDSYPFNSNSSEIKCTFDVKAMHGAKVVMTPVDVEVNGGCFDNILTVEDDTEDSPLMYPGLSAMCGQNHLPASTHPVHSSGTVRVSFFRTSNSGPVKFKVQLVASQPEICPNDVSVDHCPDGPCCEGVDCCVLHAGVQPRGENLGFNVYFEILDFLMKGFQSPSLYCSFLSDFIVKHLSFRGHLSQLSSAQSE